MNLRPRLAPRPKIKPQNLTEIFMTTLSETQRPVAKRTEEIPFLLPATNVLENRDAFVVEAEMPGVNRNGLEIALEGNTLTLTGRRDLSPSKDTALYVESKPAHFRRVFELDPTIDTEKISARLEQGLLKVHLPKAERVQPRKITVGD